jgi:hypothetical protein
LVGVPSGTVPPPGTDTTGVSPRIVEHAVATTTRNRTGRCLVDFRTVRRVILAKTYVGFYTVLEQSFWLRSLSQTGVVVPNGVDISGHNVLHHFIAVYRLDERFDCFGIPKISVKPIVPDARHERYRHTFVNRADRSLGTSGENRTCPMPLFCVGVDA